jgi:hypothetical protein
MRASSRARQPFGIRRQGGPEIPMRWKILLSLCVLITVFTLQGCFYPASYEGRLTLLSDKIGLSVEGPFGFYGTITKDSTTDKDWDFSGQFNFPNSLYFYFGSSYKVGESYPENITIELYVKKSLLGELIAPNNKQVTIGPKKIKASNEAKFKVIFKTF